MPSFLCFHGYVHLGEREGCRTSNPLCVCYQSRVVWVRASCNGFVSLFPISKSHGVKVSSAGVFFRQIILTPHTEDWEWTLMYGDLGHHHETHTEGIASHCVTWMGSAWDQQVSCFLLMAVVFWGSTLYAISHPCLPSWSFWLDT